MITGKRNQDISTRKEIDLKYVTICYSSNNQKFENLTDIYLEPIIQITNLI